MRQSWTTSSVAVAKKPVFSVHDLLHLDWRGKTLHGNFVFERGLYDRVSVIVATVRVEPLAVVTLLPKPPQPVELCVVQEEQWVIRRSECFKIAAYTERNGVVDFAF